MSRGRHLALLARQALKRTLDGFILTNLTDPGKPSACREGSRLTLFSATERRNEKGNPNRFNSPAVIAAFLPSPSSGGLGAEHGRVIAGRAEQSSWQQCGVGTG